MHTPADWPLHMLTELEASGRTRRLEQHRVESRVHVSAGNRADRSGRFATEVLGSNQAIGSEPTLFRAGS